ncbi:hypothetical protein [Nitrospina watsonii]|uniref:Capsule polysaccharide biosynthesis protein n=1 Tax=Nitrospina watsonii TaxID=1323948 RepID=A0ABM9HA53_9BACT|nr:hypothetical protein [Nitrospina watsonii]CAI2717010.1 conserved protein of unknown function [Nitrospina watsonii]
MVLSLAPAVAAHPDLECRILALTIAGNRLKPLGIPFKRCADYLPLAGYEGAVELGTRLTDEIWDASSTVPHEESCAYLGVSMTDLIESVGEEQAWDEYREKQRKAFLPIQFLEKVLEVEKPDIVVTTCHVRMEKAAHLAALKKGILSVRIEDLFGYSIFGNKPLDAPGPILPKEEWPDRIIVPNESVRQRMLAVGLEDWRVAALGQPFLSNWVDELRSSGMMQRRRAYINENKPVITFFTPGLRELLYALSKEIIKLAERRKDWKFVIKLHPGVPRNEFVAKVPALPENIELTHDTDLKELLTRSSVNVTYQSTVGYLGLLSGVSLVILNPTNRPAAVPYVSEGVALEARSDAELETAIKRQFESHDATDIKGTIFEVLPGAAERIVDYMAQLPVKNKPFPA